MARRVTIELDVDATGAVRGFRTAGDGAVGLERGLGDLKRDLDETERSLSRDLPRAAQASARAIGRDLAGSARSGQVVLTNFGRIIQDLPFGLVAIANNVDQFGESFARLSKEAGGAGGALRAILGAFSGPGGILTLISLATTAFIIFGDEIAAAFGKGERGARKMKDAISELLTVTADVRRFQLDVADAQAALDDLDKQIERIRLFPEGAEETTLAGLSAVRVRGYTAEQLALLDRLRAARENIAAQKEEREAQLLAAETLAKVKGAREEETTATDKGTRATSSSASAFERAVEAVVQLRLNLQSLRDAGIPALVELERESSFLERRLRLMQQIVEATVRPQPLTPGAPGALGEVELPESQIRTFTDVQVEEMRRLEDEMIASSERINIVLAALAESNAAIVGESMHNFAQAFADAFEASGQKTKEFFTLFKAFAIAEAIASTYVAANKALASAPAPFNFVLMASVIAAGLANVARIAATGPPGTAGGGGSSAPSSGPATRGSDTAAGLQVELPGRRFGGDVTAGQAVVVGEAGPEIFVPRFSGRIVPNQGGGAMQGGGAVDVHVTGETRVRGEDVVFVWRRADSRQRGLLGER